MLHDSKKMGSIDEMQEKIRKDLTSKKASDQELAMKVLLPAFNRFVKDNVKRGDYAEFKKMWQEENDREMVNEDYIINLADVFLEPFLPLDFDNPEKHKPVIEGFARKFAKIYT